MINPFHTRVGAIFLNEVLINAKRVAPYVLMVLFSANAIFWWHGGPAIELGWATNSDFYIARVLKAFSFLLGLPIFNAVIMGDAVIRDFRLGLVPLVFSKPITRAQYLLGKFFGSFFVLVCCQAAFPLTLIVLQAFRPARMVVQPAQVLIYFKHFFFFVVITHLSLAALYFSVGALTRNSKIVYGVAVCFYPFYLSVMLFLLRGFSIPVRTLLDPFLLNTGPSGNGFGNSAEFLNGYVYIYSADMIANRALVVLISAACLLVLYWRFSISERVEKVKEVSTLDLSSAGESVYFDSPGPAAVPGNHLSVEVRKSSPVANVTLTEKPVSAARVLRYLTNPFQTRFAAIFFNEVRLNSKRVAPYAVALLCAGNGLLWWGWGPATGHRWAVNADFFIAGVLPIYSFLFLPLYTALMMADPAIRDFRVGIDPLIFSKPISRAAYLLGKFFGNFFVLACCQSAFVVTWFVLQAVPKQGVITQQWKVIPYIKHFLVFVVISHLGLAAFYFAVGVLTRNAKIVYGLGVAFYPLYIAYQTVLLSSLPWRWKLALDPLVMNRGGKFHAISAEVMNHLVVVYEPDLIVNRATMILLAAICLTIAYLRFTIAERPRKVEELSVLNLSTAAEGVYYPESCLLETEQKACQKPDREGGHSSASEPLLTRGLLTHSVNEGIRANLNKLIATLGVEFRLLRSERSLIVLLPLALVLSIFDVAFFRVTPEVSYSATYATSTTNAMLLFLIGMAVFYTGEAMHRDRELRIEPVLWSMPVSNSVLLLSKFVAMLALTLSLVALTGATAIATQFLRGHRPVELRPYLLTYSLILFPGLVFLAAMALLVNTVLREKYVTYAVSVGLAGAMFYLYSIGYQHWLYNPLAYHLWNYADLVGVNRNVLLLQRSFWLAVAILFLALAHVCFARKTSSSVSRAGK